MEQQGYIRNGCFYCKLVVPPLGTGKPPACPKCSGANDFVPAQMRHSSCFVPELAEALDELAAMDAGAFARHAQIERVFRLLLDAAADGRAHLDEDPRFALAGLRAEYLRLDGASED